MYKHKKIKPQSNRIESMEFNHRNNKYSTSNLKPQTQDKTHMKFNLRNNKYSTEFKNKPKFKPISHKLFSNEELKKDWFYQI